MAARDSDHPTLFLCGDVITGQGIDRILRRPSEPVLYEPYFRDQVSGL